MSGADFTDGASEVLNAGVPISFSKLSSNGHVFMIIKGQDNEIRLRPSIINEHVESVRELQATVDSSTIVGQIFKASHDNINGALLTLESAGGSVLDNFEGYADSAALQVQWVETDANDKALLETTIVEAGSKSMNLPLDATLLDVWTDTISSTNYTGFNFDFHYRQNRTFSQAKLAFFVGDGTNTKSIQLTINDTDLFTHFEIDEAAMSVETNDATANPPDMAAITKIGFRLDDRQNGGEGYIDNLTAVPPPGTVLVKLWDFGASLPTSTVDALDSGTQYTEIGDRGIGGAVLASLSLPLVGGKRKYFLRGFIAGVATEIPANTVLTVGNYYGISIHYVDTDVDVYGPDSSFSIQYYNNGYAFTAPDESTAITAIGTFNDLAFSIFSTQDVYINGFIQSIDAVPGADAEVHIYAEDSNMLITDVSTVGAGAIQFIEADLSSRAFFMEMGGKFEFNYNDDFRDSVATVDVIMSYWHEVVAPNG